MVLLPLSCISPSNFICKIALSLIANGSGPKSSNDPIIPPNMMKKKNIAIPEAMITARKLGQNNLENDSLGSDMVIFIYLLFSLKLKALLLG
jgi:hypothetical protein